MGADDRIGPGDVVYVAHDCCGSILGQVFTVGRIQSIGAHCPLCQYHTLAPTTCVVNADALMHNGMAYNVPLTWVKKFKPLDDAERQEVAELFSSIKEKELCHHEQEGIYRWK